MVITINLVIRAKSACLQQEFNLIHDGGEAKRLPYQFSPLTSKYIGINSQTFLNFSFNPFATLV